MKVELVVYNPSNYTLTGNASILWSEVTSKYYLKPENIVVRDDNGVRLYAQLDPISPENQIPRRLHFALKKEIGPKESTFVTIENASCANSATIGNRDIILTQEIVWGYEGEALGVRFSNNSLIGWISLISNPNAMQDDWYAGAFTSIQFYGKELLDPFRAEMGPYEHNNEKRCMQIDNITINGEKIQLFDKHYKLIDHNIGTVKSSITIASPWIEVDKVLFRLYREISLYPSSTYLVEHLLVCDNNGNAVNFSVNYYSFIDLGVSPQIKNGQSDNYFSVSTPFDPFPSFGFTTNRKVIAVNNNQKQIKWGISSENNIAKCLHYYMRGDKNALFDEYMMRKWHKYIDQPLDVKVKGKIS